MSETFATAGGSARHAPDDAREPKTLREPNTRREPTTRRERKPLALAGFVLAAMVAVALLSGLGVWQIHRRAWKLDLIARVEQRVHAAPVAPPGPADWPQVSAARDEYRHVRLAGHFTQGRDTLVQAVTALGAGFWVLSPFETDDGFVVLVDRGFVPQDADGTRPLAPPPPSSQATVTGLLRMTEPKGAFLRSNDPARDRWYSRDVAAVAAARGLSGVAPYFVDADAGAPNAWPRGGLTVLTFPNNHLVYAFTWFGLALLVAAKTVALMLEEWRVRRSA